VDEFLHLDLSRTSERVLLPGNFTLPVFQFANPVMLQVHEIVDISLPVAQRLSLEVSSKPTFKLLLSDGFTHVIALTKGLFPQLSPTLLPGVKIVVRRGCVARFGVIFFESYQSVEIIGGFSDLLVGKCLSTLEYDPHKLPESPAIPPSVPKQRDSCALSLVSEPIVQHPPTFLESDEDDLADLVDELDPLTSGPLVPSVGEFKAEPPIGRSSVRGTVRKYGLLEIRKRGESFAFALDLVIGDDRDAMTVQASSELLEILLKSSARHWLDLSQKEQQERFRGCCKELLVMASPLNVEVRSPRLIFLLPK
jgi:hypothetical protein